LIFRSSVDELKYSFQKFNRDFLKLSEYFSFPSNQQEIPNQNLVSRKNPIVHKESMESHNVIKKEDDIFYGANEEDEQENNEINNKKLAPARANIYTNTSNKMIFESANQENHNEIKLNKMTNLMTDLRVCTTEGKIEEINSFNSLIPSHRHGKFYEPMYEERRKNMPFQRKQVSVNVWGILRDAIGKDLSKFAMPGKLKILIYKK
jgi:hypothetical protein